MISDAAQRDLALDPARSCIVQAPAGSGKTALLVYRILCLLATVDKPEHVLAITFTRKATAEMRERVFELLALAAAGKPGADAFEQQGVDLAAAVIRRDQELGWHLLNAPEQLQLQTIDAFCARLAGDMPWLSRLGDKPRTTDDAAHLYNAAIDALYSSLLEAPASPLAEALQTVLMELDYNYSRARTLFVAMLKKRDQWLRHLVNKDLNQLRDEFRATWQELVDEAIDALAAHIGPANLHELIARASRAAELIEDRSTPLAIFDLQPVSEPSQLRLAHWHGLVYMLCTSNASGLRRRINKNLGFPPEDSEHKAAMEELLDRFADDQLLLELLQAVNILPNPEYSDTDWRHLLALDKVLLRLAALLQLEFRRAGECDHSEVAMRAVQALRELENPTDLALRMDYQLKHILVDEFQDTSRSQLELLRLLTEGWQVGDGNSLFLVGDPMQSIYRFREADVSLFLQVAQNGEAGVFDNLEIQALQLKENFRSSAQLVDWFNQTFKQSFPQQDDVLTGAIRYAEASSNKEIPGSVVAELVHDKEQQAQHVVAHVQHFLSSQADGEIAILVRTRNQLQEIIPALEAAGIAYKGVDLKPLHQVAAIQDLVTLCTVLTRPQQRLTWFALLRSPLLGLTLKELQQLADGDIWDNLQQQWLAGRFSDATQQRLARFIPAMQSAFAQKPHVALHRLTRWLWQQLGGRATQVDVSDVDIDRVLIIIEKLEVGGDLPSLAELHKGLESLFAQPLSQTQRVVISTIHKAKGLQYHTVILPSLERKASSDDKQVLQWAERNSRDGEARLMLAPINAASGDGLHHDYLSKLQSQRARQEMIRVLYVACTRAEQQLILLATHQQTDDGEVKAPIANSLLGSVWAALEEKSTSAPAAAERDVTGSPELAASKYVWQRLAENFQLKVTDSVRWQSPWHGAEEEVPEQPEYAWATPLATAVGTVLHDWLEHHHGDLFSISIDQHQRRLWRAELAAQRLPEERMAQALERLTQAVYKMQSDEHAQFVFAPHAEQQNELSLTAYEGGRFKSYRIDRTFVDQQNRRWIVDYKTTTTKQEDLPSFVDTQVAERHRPQLQNYGRLMSQIDSREIILAVYFPLLGELRQWSYSNG